MKKLLLILLAVILLAQLIRPKQDNNGPAATASDITHVVPVPDSILAILKPACFDCHSNHTTYPWYAQITPVNWWLENHIGHGKRALNFSEFATYTYKKKAHRMDDIAETVEKHEMPLNSYLWIHKDARLTDAQRQALIAWSKAAAPVILQDSLAHAAH